MAGEESIPVIVGRSLGNLGSLDRTDAVQERNRDLSPEEAEALADEALDWARATRP